ncbi:RNA polymerase sigma-B factor [Sedimentibacter acidaminivorans]|uniref:RNA polymerase sigma-B factor n=1 Tax=Sedimentibacter acidaminivorans TaxID=913099 RepID=A0ABS4GDU2_9FIRM|nr:sigma-70 family RNA polymerase sigma factor [Sedimentibacter acidaminivorans]MBP1925849.1 RNA polymerase sigma-B factor [Sedimentibacter acidaminivorans]
MNHQDSNEHLIELIKKGIDTEENYLQLYEKNHGFIYQTIRNRVHGINEIDDLMQSAFLALVKAVERYDITRPLEESNFLQILKFCIWNEIRSLEIDLPAHMIQKIIKYKKVYNQLRNELGYEPKGNQIRLEMCISLDELDNIKAAMQIKSPTRLNEPIGEDGTATRMDLIANSISDDSEEECNDNSEKQELKRIVHEKVDSLPDASRDIINMRYFENKTLKSISEEKGVSVERVRQREKEAMLKLRRDVKFREKVIDYTSINMYKNVGSRRFNNTWTSSTELVVFDRERIREREVRK